MARGESAFGPILAQSNVVPIRAEKTPPPLPATIASSLEGSHSPREWLIQGIIPRNEVTILSGLGAVGKSLSCMMMMISTAVGLPIWGRNTVTCRSHAIFSEDDRAELHARRDRICSHIDYCVNPLDLDDKVSWTDIDDLDTEPGIYHYSRWGKAGRATPLWERLSDYCQSYSIELLFLDHAGNVFDGDDLHVKSFLWWLRKQAKTLGMSIVLLLHPDKARLYWHAGNRAWGNAPRHSLALQKAQKIDEEGPHTPFNGEVVLWSPKSNILAWDDPLQRGGLSLKWQDGVLVSHATAATTWPMSAPEKSALDGKVLSSITKAIERGHEIKSDPKHARSFARRVCDVPGWKDYPRWVLDSSIDRLLDDKKLRVDGDGLLQKTSA